MGPILNGLVKLQSIENRLRAAKAKLARCRRNVVIQENQIRSLQNALNAKKEEVQLTRIQSDRLELELKSREESVAKYRAMLNTAKTNKEYSAVLVQINTTSADNSKIETQVLDLLKDIEVDQAEVDTINQQIEEQKAKLSQVRGEAESLSMKYQSDIEQVQQEWDQMAKDVPSEVLDIFTRVAETYDGEALAIVESGGNKMKAYSCGGCFMGITAETVNLLLTKDDIIRCPNCTRLLILADSQES